MSVGKGNDQTAVAIHIQGLAMADLITAHQRNLLADGDAPGLKGLHDGILLQEEVLAHGVKLSDQFRGQGRDLLLQNAQRTGYVAQLLGQLMPMPMMAQQTN